jgi:DNA-binding transcriptional MerR regulator
MEEVIEKRYWGIGELADKFSRSTSAIRYYCDYFGIQPARNGHNNRRFTQADVDRLSNILAYVQQGYHLKAIKNKI